MNIQYIYSKILKKLRGASVRDSSVHRTSKVESGSLVVGTTMGRYSFCGYDCQLMNCEIGSFCSIASRVSIGGVAHPMHFVSTSPTFLSHKDSVKTKFAHHEFLPKLTTKIGHDVWIGEGVLIRAGVTIGSGSVIGMGSVVTKDVEAYSVVAGNPAKVIRKRFDSSMCEQLLSMAWWNMTEKELEELGDVFNEPELLIARKKTS